MPPKPEKLSFEEVGNVHPSIAAGRVSCKKYLCCVAAKEAFAGGFVHPDRLPEADEMFLDGDVGYHLRTGTHYFARPDWHRLIEFVKKHRKVK